MLNWCQNNHGKDFMAQFEGLLFYNAFFCQLMFDFCQLVDEVRDLNWILDENRFQVGVVKDDVNLGSFSPTCLQKAFIHADPKGVKFSQVVRIFLRFCDVRP